MSARAKRTVVYAVVVAVAIFSVWTAQRSAERASQNSSDLQAGLIEGCETSGNPLRKTVQDILREDIKKSAELPPSFFPGIPPATFHRLVKEKRESNEAKIKLIEPIDCAAQYGAH